MKRSFLFSIFTVFSFLIASAQADWLWASSSVGTGNEAGTKIAVDANGNSYVTGEFMNSSVTFGSTTLTNAGGRDLFIVKYNASGNVVWAKSAGGANEDGASGITTDASGNIYITGSFQSSSITFGSTTLNIVGSSGPGSGDVFIAKYDPNGNVLWAKSHGGSLNDGGGGITTDANGNMYLTGYYHSSTITFGTTTLTNAGFSDIFIAKYDASGNVLWVKSAGSSELDTGYGIAADNSGNSYATGYFGLSITFGTTTLTSAGGIDIFITKYDPSGNVLSAKSYGGSGGEAGYGITTNASGDIYVTGAFQSSPITLGTLSLNNTGNLDMFIGKFRIVCTAPSTPGTITGSVSPCSGSTQTYSVAAVAGATSYSWSLPTGWTGTSTAASITVTTGTGSGNITVAAVNSCGTSTAQALAVNVSASPAATVTASGTTSFCEGNSVTLTANTGTGLTYQWRVNNTNITNASNSSYTANASGNYTVLVTNGSCSATSAPVTVTVHPNPAPVLTQAGSILSTAAGLGTYKWYKDGTVISGATDNSYTVLQNGTYYVVVTSSNNCSGQSNTINVTTVSVPSIELQNEISLYPNPITQFVLIKHPVKQIGLISIYDLSGKKVFERNTKEKQVELDLSSLPAGTYFIRTSGSGKYFKIVKM